MLCEATCGIVVEMEGERILSVRGDPEDPLSRGFVCPKVVGMRELHEDPDRLRQPLVKEGGSHRPASWEEALDRAARGLAGVRDGHGKDALAVYQGNPAAHNLGLLTVGQVVLRSFGTKNLYSASSADQVPQMLAAELMFGNSVLMPVPDLERTEYLLVLGANPLVSNGSLMTAPNMRRRLEEIRGRGGRVVVVDPRRTETAEVADEHVFIRPGADPLFLLSLLSVIFAEGLARPERFVDATTGFDALEKLASQVTPEEVAKATGVDPERTRQIARGFASARCAAAYGRVGICHQEHGTVASWLVYALNVVTGNLDRPGGAMFTTPAVEVQKVVRLLGIVGHDRWKSRVRGYGEVGGELPIATLADEIETPGPGQVRALLTCAGNPVLSAPNGARLDAALGRLAFMVSVDAYVNETTRHADVILPPVSVLERSHYDVALNAFAVRNVAKYVRPPIPPKKGALTDADILSQLAVRMRLTGPSLATRAAKRVALGVARAVGPDEALDALLLAGPYRMTRRRLAKHPHGLDLGPLKPRLAKAIETSDGRVHLCPERLAAEARQLVSELLSDGDGTIEREPALSLIGRRHLRSNNSWMHNARALVKGKERCTLLMNPEDARALRLVDGARVEVSSTKGSVVVLLEVTSEVMEGVVSLPHGFGHARAGTRLSVANAHAGASLNDLTDDERLDRTSGNAAFNGLRVQVRPAPAPSPASG